MAEPPMTAARVREIIGEQADKQFADHLASDLAPILSLFGENVARQYMSSMTGWADSIIFAMGPQGVITAVSSAIRVGGPTWLKAIVGRARENISQAEVELMSSTSKDVCEVWSGQQVVRLIGQPEITELILLPEAPKVQPASNFTRHVSSSKEHLTATEVEMTDLSGGKTAKAERIPIRGGPFDLLTLEEAKKKRLLKLAGKHRLDFWRRRAYEELKAEASDEPLPELPKQSARAPNISLNLYDHISRWELYAVAAIGTILQVSVWVYMGFAAHFKPLNEKLTLDEQDMPAYGSPLAQAGGVVLVIGLICCTHVVETSTKEHRYAREPTGDYETDVQQLPRIMWLQKGTEINDMHFDSYAIFARGPHHTVITSERRRKKGENAGQQTSADGHLVSGLETLTVFGTIVTIAGFIANFTGIRSLHYSVATSQLFVMVVMMILRSIIRRRLAVRPFVQKLPKDHEIDWLATHAVSDNGGSGLHEQMELFWGNDLPIEDLQEKKNDAFWSSDCHNLDIEKMMLTRNPMQLQRLAQVMETRMRLSWSIHKWKSPTWKTANKIAASINAVMNSPLFNPSSTIVAESTDPNTGEVNLERFEWRIPGVEAFTFKAWRVPKEKWHANVFRIDAFLSLWLYSSRTKENQAKRASDPRISSNRSETAVGQSLRILGRNTPRLRQDLKWWLGKAAQNVVEMTPNEKGDIRVPDHHVIGLKERIQPNARSETSFNLNKAFLDDDDEVERAVQDAADNLARTRTTKPTRARTVRGPRRPASTSGTMPQYLAAISGGNDLESLYGQALFSAFMANITERGLVKVPEDDESDYNEEMDLKSLQVRNKHLESVTQQLKIAGLAEEVEDIRLCLLPPLSEANLLRSATDVCRLYVDRGWNSAREDDWDSAVDTIKFLFNVSMSFAPEDEIPQKAAAILVEFLIVLKAQSVSAYQPVTKRKDFADLYKDLCKFVKAVDFDYRHILRRLDKMLERQLRRGDVLNSDLLKIWADGNSHLLGGGDPQWEGFYSSMAPWFVNVVAGHRIDFSPFDTAEIETARDLFEWTALHYACADTGPNAVTNMRFILRNVPAARKLVNSQDLTGYSPLHYAILSSENEYEKAQLLLEYGADLRLCTRDHLQAFHIAAQHGKFNLIKLFFSQKQMVDTNAKDLFKRTPLHYAAGSPYGSVEILQLLKENDANLEAKDCLARTPFHTAVVLGQLENCRKLVEMGANPTEKDVDSLTALHMAMHPDNGTREMIEYLLSLGLHHFARDRYKQTPMHFAANYENLTAMEILVSIPGVQEKYMIEAEDVAGERPLHEAVREGRYDAVNWLVRHGADCFAKDRKGISPIQAASSPDILVTLLDKLPSAPQEEIVVQEKILEELTHELRIRLINLGARVLRPASSERQWDQSLESLLHYASRKDDRILAETIIASGRSLSLVDEKDQSGYTPLYIAVATGSARVARCLMAVNANRKVAIRTKNLQHNTLLHDIAEKPFNQNLFIELLASGSPPDIFNNRGYTPLLAAAASRSPHSVTALKFLVEMRANTAAIVDRGTLWKYTALHLAVTQDPTQAATKVKYLLEADPSILYHKTPSGDTAMSFAEKRNLQSVLKIIHARFQSATARMPVGAVPVPYAPTPVPAPQPQSAVPSAAMISPMPQTSVNVSPVPQPSLVSVGSTPAPVALPSTSTTSRASPQPTHNSQFSYSNTVSISGRQHGRDPSEDVEYEIVPITDMGRYEQTPQQRLPTGNTSTSGGAARTYSIARREVGSGSRRPQPPQ